MAIPLKRFARPLLGLLSESEMQALLQAMDNSWSGRRDHLLFLFLYNTEARVPKLSPSECKPRADLLNFLDSL